jgi:hypothetical protein
MKAGEQTGRSGGRYRLVLAATFQSTSLPWPRQDVSRSARSDGGFSILSALPKAAWSLSACLPPAIRPNHVRVSNRCIARLLSHPTEAPRVRS